MGFSYLNNIFDFVLPRLCITCDTKLNNREQTLCFNCSQSLTTVPLDIIEIEYSRKFQTDKLITDFAALYTFEENSTIQKVIHSLKYNQNYHAGYFLGRNAAEILKNKILFWNADILIPIPLHNLRKHERGFNQAKEISKGVSSGTGISTFSNILRRKRFTQTQTKFTLKERKENIKDAFSIKNKKLIKGKKIVLVDDVITTGATISECATVLLNNGAKSVYALSAALAD